MIGYCHHIIIIIIIIIIINVVSTSDHYFATLNPYTDHPSNSPSPKFRNFTYLSHLAKSSQIKLLRLLVMLL